MKRALLLRPAALAALCLLSLLAAGFAPRADPPTTVIVVRHAEKALVEGRDPPLSAAGEQRALDLREVLADAGVGAVYATQFQRTRDTAKPLADHLGLPVRVQTVESAEAYAKTVAREVLDAHRGRAVLVVSHSNTVPLIVHALGGPAMPDLAESDYDNLFIVTVPEDGPVRTIRALFGEASD